MAGHQACARGALLSLGLAGLLWFILSAPTFWSALSAQDLTLRILASERFKPGALDETLARLEPKSKPMSPHPRLARERAMIQLRRAEEALQRLSAHEPQQEMFAAKENLKSSLMLNPADALAWFMLYSASNDSDGFDQENIKFLSQSYLVGPREGWIALRRNRMALAVFLLLSRAMQDRVVSEFADMVDAELTELAASNLTGIGWGYRERLLASLEHVDILPREIFAKRLARDGVKVNVPGVDVNERPW